jgi:hypothetical protein
MVKRKKSYTHFQTAVARQLLETVELPAFSVCGRPCSSTPLRLQAKNWAHFPMHISATEKKKNPSKMCSVCFQQGKRCETTWQCKKRGVPLHIPSISNCNTQNHHSKTCLVSTNFQCSTVKFWKSLLVNFLWMFLCWSVLTIAPLGFKWFKSGFRLTHRMFKSEVNGCGEHSSSEANGLMYDIINSCF